MAHQHLTDADRAVPQLRPIREVKLVFAGPVTPNSLEPILLGGDLVEDAVGVADLYERNI